jgi:glycine/D-amino acid oxidase-like deaminating enzyme
MAQHMGGSYIACADSPVQPPGPADLDPLAAIAAKYMPRLAGDYEQARSRLRHSATCLYTMTPDDDFIVDHHPEFTNVVFAAGFSGHGFKFAPLIAVALADLLLQGKTELPIGFLSLNRLLQKKENALR